MVQPTQNRAFCEATGSLCRWPVVGALAWAGSGISGPNEGGDVGLNNVYIRAELKTAKGSSPVEVVGYSLI